LNIERQIDKNKLNNSHEINDKGINKWRLARTPSTAAIVNVASVIARCSYDFFVALWRAKDAESTRMNPQKTTIAILATLSAISLAMAEDFKTIDGKIYKDATVSHVEADGIVIRTKTGISKIYFVELPKDVQERFHYGSPTPAGNAVTQRIGGESLADKFAQQVQKRLDERESILQGKHTPGPAELMLRREINFHWAFLAGTAIIASVLFAIVWARVK